ncbi:MAG TPA: HAD-IC family P-type ATPase [Pseudonocardia sp.]|nr:HAD-IC family P-type ATPase [Pseudonocardia sp.]
MTAPDVERAGPGQQIGGPAAASDAHPVERGPADRRLILSVALAVPVLVLSTVPAWQFRHWQWIALALAAPVAVWGAWPLHRGAARLLRRGEAGPDTLGSLGTLAALGWSLCALLLGAAGEPGTTQPFDLTVGAADAPHLEVAAGAPVLILLGRLLDARYRRHVGAVGAVDADAAGPFVPIMITLAVATLGFWLGAGAAPGFAAAAAVAVLLVACPRALGLAAPTALLAGTARGARFGILIAGRHALASAHAVDTVLLDRTGMVTTGEMAVHGVHPAAGVDAALVLRLAGSVEQASAHPVGRAIAAAAQAGADGELPDVAEFDSSPGLGVRGVVAEVADGAVLAHAVLVGRPELLAEHDIELPAELVAARAAATAAGHTAVVVAWDGIPRAVIAVRDTVRPGSAQAVRGLRALGLRPMLLTGDDGAAARVLAERIGIDADAVLPEVRPECRLELIRRLQGEGRTVALIGDGPDDATLLAAADLGLAADARTDGVDLGLARHDPLAVLDAIRLARHTLAVGRTGLLLAIGYHLLALPLAGLGLLDPLIAAAAMVCGPVLVVTNSLRLHRFYPGAPDASPGAP